MPFINVKLAQKLTDTELSSLKAGLGKAIELIPGKNESALMLDIEDGKNMFFHGDSTVKCAYVDVQVYGVCPLDAKAAYTREIFALFNRVLGIDPGEMFVNMTERNLWGARGELR